MSRPQFGEIEEVDLRKGWPREASDFTKWLAEEENLNKLAQACSIELELVEIESQVGDFSVDILAKESGTDSYVVIENQLEDTDHDHLGKIITYAAGKEAETAIWVVKRARDEHRKAIEWLNNNTDARHSFFLVEIALWRIGDSPVAPRFNVVESPNNWARAEKTKELLNDTERLQLEYWQAYNEYDQNDASFMEVLRPRKALPYNWSNLSVGTTKYSLTLNIRTSKNKVGVEVTSKDDKFGQYILNHQSEIEKDMGLPGEPYDASKSRGIRFFHTGCDIRKERSKWNEFIKWQLERTLVLRDIMKRLEARFEQECVSIAPDD